MKRDWNTRSAILIVALILIVVNVIGLNVFGRLDLTDDNVYTLSDASIELVEGLADPVTVTAFFTEGLPAPFSNNRRFLKDKLDDYQAYGGQNFQYRFVDPGDDAELKQQAQQYQIPAVQVRVIESDNVQLKNAFMGYTVEYGGEREVVPVIQDLSTLEYDITGAIQRLTRDMTPVVGVLSGHGEPAIQQSMASLQQNLQRNYDVREAKIEDGVLSPSPDVLLVVAPTDSLSEDDLRALDEYTMQGGKTAFLLNRITADLQRGQATAYSVGLEPLLSTWGMGLAQDLVMDRQSSVVNMRRQMGGFNVSQQVPYPFFVVSQSFNPDNMMVNRLREVPFYFVSSVDTSLALPEGVERDILIRSSPASTLQRGYFMIQVMPDMAMDYSDGPFPLAAAYSGTFPSAFESGVTSVDTRMVLVGDGDFIDESAVGAIPSNIEFVQNMIDWLVQDEDMLSIRSKKAEPRMLQDVSEGARPWVKYANMIGPVILVILIGLVRWNGRRNRQIILKA